MTPDLDHAARLAHTIAEAEEAKLTWLRGAATEAFASLDRGEGLRFDSREQLNAHSMEISEEVFADRAGSRRL